jgi:hypothetical protein
MVALKESPPRLLLAIARAISGGTRTMPASRTRSRVLRASASLAACSWPFLRSRAPLAARSVLPRAAFCCATAALASRASSWPSSTSSCSRDTYALNSCPRCSASALRAAAACLSCAATRRFCSASLRSASAAWPRCSQAFCCSAAPRCAYVACSSACRRARRASACFCCRYSTRLAARRSHLMRDAIRGHQRSSEVIRGHQRRGEATGCTRQGSRTAARARRWGLGARAT